MVHGPFCLPQGNRVAISNLYLSWACKNLVIPLGSFRIIPLCYGQLVSNPTQDAADITAAEGKRKRRELGVGKGELSGSLVQTGKNPFPGAGDTLMPSSKPNISQRKYIPLGFRDSTYRFGEGGARHSSVHRTM